MYCTSSFIQYTIPTPFTIYYIPYTIYKHPCKINARQINANIYKYKLLDKNVSFAVLHNFLLLLGKLNLIAI